MSRVYRITAITEGPDPRAGLQGPLSQVDTWSYARGGQQAYEWNFEESDFSLIPELRAWLREKGIAKIEEQGMRRRSDDILDVAPLLHITGGVLENVRVLAADVFQLERCPDCGWETKKIVSNPSLHIELPGTDTPRLFSLQDVDVWIASANLISSLEQAALWRGLESFPISAENSGTGPHVGLYASVDLGWPAAPFGRTGTKCGTCGRYVVRSYRAGDTRVYPGLPRYSFYMTFEHPGQDAHWMWTEQYGQGDLIITRETRVWLSESVPGLWRAQDSVRAEINFRPYGWYPDEADKAFLEGTYQE